MSVNIKLKTEIDRIFAEAPKTRKALELNEEIYANAEEKLADLISKGHSEEDAYQVVIHSIGNVEELFGELAGEEQTEWERRRREALDKKRAVLTAVSVGIYILAGVVFFGGAAIEDADIALPGGVDGALMGFIAAILICIVPTMILVYTSLIYPRYKKKEDTMVEEYREWKEGNTRDRAVRKAISSVIWSLTVVIYLLLSFLTGYWHITWIIFIIAGCVESIVGLLFSLRNQ